MFPFPRKDLSNIASLRDLFPLHLNQISPLRMLQAKAKSLKLGLQWKPQLDDCRTDTKYFQISLEALSGGEQRQHTGRHKQVFTLHPRGFKSIPHHLPGFCVGFVTQMMKKDDEFYHIGFCSRDLNSHCSPRLSYMVFEETKYLPCGILGQGSLR